MSGCGSPADPGARVYAGSEPAGPSYSGPGNGSVVDRHPDYPEAPKAGDHTVYNTYTAEAGGYLLPKSTGEFVSCVDHVPGDLSDNGQINIPDVRTLPGSMDRQSIRAMEAAPDSGGDGSVDISAARLPLKSVKDQDVGIA